MNFVPNGPKMQHEIRQHKAGKANWKAEIVVSFFLRLKTYLKAILSKDTPDSGFKKIDLSSKIVYDLQARVCRLGVIRAKPVCAAERHMSSYLRFLAGSVFLLFSLKPVGAVNVSSFSPTVGSPGDQVTILGSGFYPGTLVVRFNGVQDPTAQANAQDGTCIV